MQNRNVLISGAGCAGQSLAFWLNHYGFKVTVVERTSAPRVGGFAVDLRGAAIEVSKRMGIWEACVKARVNMREIVRFDQHGTRIWAMAGNTTADDIEILRDDLTQILGKVMPSNVEFIFWRLHYAHRTGRLRRGGIVQT